MNFDDCFAQASRQEKREKGDEQVPASESGQVEKGVRDGRHESHRHEGVLPHVREQRRLQSFDQRFKLAQIGRVQLQILLFFFELLMFLAKKTRFPCDEVRRQFPDGRAQPPQKSLQLDLLKNVEESESCWLETLPRTGWHGNKWKGLRVV